MNRYKKLALTAIAGLSLGLLACQKNDANGSQKSAAENTDNKVEKISIGFQKSSLNLLVTREQKLLEQQFPAAKIEWREFPAGPQMLEALAIGAVDIGAVGNTPPIFAQAADKDLSYAGYEVYPPTSLGIVLAKNSAIKNIRDLKGKRIAVQKGSSAHELLAKVLEKAGLTWQDIQPIWLPPADARAALDKGSVDAWSIWDPYLSAIELTGKVDVLIDGKDFAKTYAYYIANPKFSTAHPQALDKVLYSLNQADTWIVNNQAAAIDLYASSTGLSKEIAKYSIDRRLKPSPVRSVTAETMASQQKIADLFFAEKLIPKQINIQDAIQHKAVASN